MRTNKILNHWTLLAVVVASIFVISACGGDDRGGVSAISEDDTAGVRKIEPDRILTFDDFQLIGFKKGKSYDVSELPEAEAAYYGFWGLEVSSRDDFELRIYASQIEAVEHGTQLTDQRVGPGALLTKDTAVWQIGIKDARTCFKSSRSGSAAGRDCTVAKYYDYMFVGNVILFCPGLNIDDARNNCDDLVARLY